MESSASNHPEQVLFQEGAHRLILLATPEREDTDSQRPSHTMLQLETEMSGEIGSHKGS